jgi:hypothetical protein
MALGAGGVASGDGPVVQLPAAPIRRTDVGPVTNVAP